MDGREYLSFDSSAASSVDAYYEYRMIVGDDDGGRTFTPKEYEKYKKRVLPMRLKNRLYVSWQNKSGLDCKLVGPETLCFCQHRYKQHKTDFENFPTSNRQVKCEVRGCRCSGYFYQPKNGSQPLRCHCKHQATEHDVSLPYKCSKAVKCKCDGFKSSFRCGCGDKTEDHRTLIESRNQRLERGHPVSKVEPPYKAMGGVTGMTSLLDGYMRLDESGIGAPTQQWFDENPGTSLRPSRTAPTNLTAGLRTGPPPSVLRLKK